MALLALLLYPVRTTATRGLLLLALTASAVSLLGICWRRRPVRYALLTLLSAAAGFLLFPGHPADPPALRSAYVAALERYTGTIYVWGGETRRGIDCSGLVRAAMVDALVGEGLRTCNAALLRRAANIWWNDCTARELVGHPLTQVVGPTRAIRVLPAGTLLPGDLAVTADGSHVLAYLGAGRWIEADPTVMRVIILTDGSAHAEWLNRPVTIVRWR